MQAKVPEHLSLAICPSGASSLTYTLDAHIIFIMIFTFFIEIHLLGNTELLSLIV